MNSTEEDLMVNARKADRLCPKLQPVTTLFPVFSVACSSDASLPIQFCERSVDCSKYAVYAVYMESALSHGD